MHRDVKARFGTKPRKLRKRQGLTQEEIAEFLGLDRSYVAEIELGKRNVCIVDLEVIAKGLNMSLSQLFARI